jgi:glycosyltransferase involved in cell wall biosynthesis
VISQAAAGVRSDVESGVFVHRVGTDPRRYSIKARANYYFHAWLKLTELIAREPIDVVQADYWSAEGLTLALRKQKPLILWSQSSPLDAIRSRSYRGVIHLLGLLVLQHMADVTAKRATIVVADSNANYTDCVRRLHLDPVRCTIVHPGVDTNKFRFVASGIKDSLGIPRQCPIALFIGRLERRKGVEVLLRAMPKIVDFVPEVRFVIAGKDINVGFRGRSFYEKILQQARAHGYLNNLIRLDSVPEDTLVQLYSASDVLLFPSLHESFGFPVIEAMACGKPVVAARTGIVPEIGFDGRSGSVVPVGDADSLAREAVKYLLLGTEEKAAIAQVNSEIVRSRFSARTWVGKMEEVYELALSSTRAKRTAAPVG